MVFLVLPETKSVNGAIVFDLRILTRERFVVYKEKRCCGLQH